MLATPAAVPPTPATDPTSCFGKQSEGIVITLTIQLWKQKAIRLTPARATASLRVLTTAATPTGTRNALPSITTLRARSTLHPRRIRRLESPPPERFPRSAKRNGIQASIPISASVKPRSFLISWLPNYLKNERGFTLALIGMLAW